MSEQSSGPLPCVFTDHAEQRLLQRAAWIPLDPSEFRQLVSELVQQDAQFKAKPKQERHVKFRPREISDKEITIAYRQDWRCQNGHSKPILLIITVQVTDYVDKRRRQAEKQRTAMRRWRQKNPWQ